MPRATPSPSAKSSAVFVAAGAATRQASIGPVRSLATALLLQAHDRVSDAEAKAQADFDIRWKVALGIGIEERPFAKSTFQVFHAQLIQHDTVREVFEQSLRLAREAGYLKGKRGMRVGRWTRRTSPYQVRGRLWA